jgi:murein DD-endopeptidase
VAWKKSGNKVLPVKPAAGWRAGPVAAGLLALLLAGCASGPPVESAQITAKREIIIEEALGEVGRPYRFGGEDTEGFDCSGLVQYTYGEAGVRVPRVAADLRHAGTRIRLRQALPGDLLFFSFDNGGGSSLHVAVYLGNGRMVHAPSHGKTVSVSHTGDAPWPDRFLYAVRLLD